MIVGVEQTTTCRVTRLQRTVTLTFNENDETPWHLRIEVTTPGGRTIIEKKFKHREDAMSALEAL